MNSSLSSQLYPQAALLETEDGRQRMVTVALYLVQGTHLMPSPYEQMLLDQFVRGDLTLEEVEAYLDAYERE